jgi:(1->4)-alpha-D-glucan 1-alpha-D-glucosylmutase
MKPTAHATRSASCSSVSGVPDRDLSLVDPDNRRPVDYVLRRKLLGELPQLTASEVLRRSDEGLPKLWTIYQALRLRNEQPEIFGDRSSYTPLHAAGSKAEHLVAYMRADRVIALAPRLVIKLNNNWGDTRIDLPNKSWINRLTGKTVRGGTANISELLNDFRVALLLAE